MPFEPSILVNFWLKVFAPHEDNIVRRRAENVINPDELLLVGVLLVGVPIVMILREDAACGNLGDGLVRLTAPCAVGIAPKRWTLDADGS